MSQTGKSKPGSAMSKKTECVKVAVRCRPLSETEIANNKKCIVKINQKNGEVIV